MDLAVMTAIVEQNQASPAAGALAGAISGLLAAWAMNAAQDAFPVKSQGNSDPATVRAAKPLARALTGRPLARHRKNSAGNAVHYAFGALLGAVYGAAAECWPVLTRGRGIPFGLAVSSVVDEMLVPALGLAPPPWKSPARLHAYGAVSHILFGAVAEVLRKNLRPAL